MSISDMTPNATTIAALIEAETADDIVKRLRNHVNNRGGPSIANGAWEMMLEAADEIERLRDQSFKYLQEVGRQAMRADKAEGVTR